MKNSLKKSILTLMLGVSSIAFCGQADSAMPVETTSVNTINVEAASETPLMQAVKEVNLEKVQALIDAGADVNQTNQLGFAPLWYAVESGNPHLVNTLLKNGAQIDMIFPGGRTVLSKAAEGSPLIVLFVLLQAGASLNMPDTDGNTPLMRAALQRQLDHMEHLLHYGAFVDIKNNKGESALGMVQSTELSRYLNFPELFIKEFAHELKNGTINEQLTREHLALINARAAERLEAIKKEGVPTTADAWATPITTALWTCIDEDEVYAVVEKLIALGENVNSEDIYGDTPLMDAIRHGYTKVVKLLLDKGADISQAQQKYRYGSTPVYISANGLDVGRIMDFLSYGIGVIGANKNQQPKRRKEEINIKESAGRTPLGYAREKGYAHIVDLLEKTAPNMKVTLSVQEALDKDDWEAVHAAIAAGADPNGVYQDALYRGQVLLVYAVVQKDLPLVKMLVERGADINGDIKAASLGNKIGFFTYEPPLFTAVATREYDIIKYLLQKGANPNLRSPLPFFGRILDAAVDNKDLKAAEWLIAAGAQVNEIELRASGLKDDSIPMVMLLVRSGLDLNSDKNEEALIEAVRFGSVNMVQLLLMLGAPKDTAYPNGKTALDFAMDTDDKRMVDVLRKAGVVTGRELFGNDEYQARQLSNALWSSIRSGETEDALKAIEAGADVNRQYRESLPFTYAILKSHTAMFNLLLKHGALVNGKDDKGNTALMCLVDEANSTFKGLKSWAENEEALDRMMSRDGYLQKLRALLNAGARIDIKDNEGKTVLDTVQWSKMRELLEKTASERGILEHNSQKKLSEGKL